MSEFRAKVSNNGAKEADILQIKVLWFKLKHCALDYLHARYQAKLVKDVQTVVATFNKLVEAEEFVKALRESAKDRSRNKQWLFGPWFEMPYFRVSHVPAPKKEMVEWARQIAQKARGQTRLERKEKMLSDLDKAAEKGKVKSITLVPDDFKGTLPPELSGSEIVRPRDFMGESEENNSGDRRRTRSKRKYTESP